MPPYIKDEVARLRAEAKMFRGYAAINRRAKATERNLVERLRMDCRVREFVREAKQRDRRVKELRATWGEVTA